jgi:hypothetical protein
LARERNDRLTAPAIGRRAVLGGMLALPIAACTSIAPQALNSLGSKVDKAKVDFPLLHQMARRADDSQRSEAEIRAKWPNVTKVAMIQSVGVRYVIEQDHGKKAQYLSMPGSLNLKDWLEDFDLFLKPEARHGIPLHRGFEDSALAVRAEVTPQLRRDYRTYVTGYSMGAGIAAVLSLYLRDDGYNLVRTTTYGQPRVTNAVGAAKLASLPITRVVNVDDFVSMVPTFPFEHFGEEVILHPGADFVYLTHQDANAISIGEIWRESHGLSIANHASELYVARLAQKLKGAQAVPYLPRLA